MTFLSDKIKLLWLFCCEHRRVTMRDGRNASESKNCDIMMLSGQPILRRIGEYRGRVEPCYGRYRAIACSKDKVADAYSQGLLESP